VIKNALLIKQSLCNECATGKRLGIGYMNFANSTRKAMAVNEEILQALTVETLDGFEVAAAAAPGVPLDPISQGDVLPALTVCVLPPE
jgi:hypothetical protein